MVAIAESPSRAEQAEPPVRVVRLPYNYDPHANQRAFHANPARIRVLACGARFGKDRACINDLIVRCLRIAQTRPANPTLIPFVHAWIVAPTFALARQSWAELQAFTPPELAAKVNNSLLQMRIPTQNGEILIEVKSADDPKKLVSVGLDYLLVTEASLVPEMAWQSSLRPRLASPGRAGLAVLNSTPRGRNWFYHVFLRGQDPDDTTYASWNMPTAANPYIDPNEIEQMRSEMPDRWFRQEIMAEFLSDSGGVFRKVRERIDNKAMPKGPVYLGVDWAMVHDFTVVTAMQGGHVVGIDRFNQIGWGIQRGRLAAFASVFNPVMIMPESNSIGGPNIEQLQAELSFDVQGFETTPKSKRALIDHLVLGIERGEVTFPDSSPHLIQMINELEAYEYSVSKAGNVKMQAPAGYHDDCVMSLALAYWAQERGSMPAEAVVLR